MWVRARPALHRRDGLTIAFASPASSTRSPSDKAPVAHEQKAGDATGERRRRTESPPCTTYEVICSNRSHDRCCGCGSHITPCYAIQRHCALVSRPPTGCPPQPHAHSIRPPAGIPPKGDRRNAPTRDPVPVGHALALPRFAVEVRVARARERGRERAEAGRFAWRGADARLGGSEAVEEVSEMGARAGGRATGVDKWARSRGGQSATLTHKRPNPPRPTCNSRRRGNRRKSSSSSGKTPRR